MKYIRIIPRLDIKGPNLVKGIHFEGLRVLGKPENFARLYYEQGADELIYQDTVASLYQRNSLTEIITRTKVCFCEKIGKNVNFYYLGYYIKWIPQEAYYYAVENTGFKANPERTEGTYSKYNSLDDRIDGFHYWSTFVKFGIGRATYDASQEIRNKHLTREEGQALVKRFDGEFPKSILMKY